MMEFLDALARYQFLQFAVAAAVLAGLGCGIIGPYVLVRRITFLAGGIAHSALGGMGVALYYGVAPLWGALIAALLSALLIGFIRLRWRTGEDTLIGAVWAIGMAIGLLFLSRMPGYQADLVSYLFGNILLVPERELLFMAGLDAALLLVVGLWHRQILAVAFDEEYARIRGLPATFFYLLLLVLVALTVVLLIHVVGLILVLALLTLPAAVAGRHARSVGGMMALGSALGIGLGVFGLAVSYGPNLPPGPTIVLLAGATYLLSGPARRST